MKLGLVAVVSIFVTAVFAGCADSEAAVEKPVLVPESAKEVQVTKQTGAIRGLVVDATIKPVKGVNITLTTAGLSTVTAEDGGFVFSNLEPGDYFVSASKANFQSIQTSTTVVAGVADPKLVRIILPLLEGALAPYANTQMWRGFLQCGFTAGMKGVPSPIPDAAWIGFNACGVVDDRFINYFTVDSIPNFAQAEMIWKNTQPVSESLSLGFWKTGTSTHWANIQGKSPLLLTATDEQIIKGTQKGRNTTDNPMRVFPPYWQFGNPTQPEAMSINQAFDVYLSQFYGFLPTDGWLFRIDGPCTEMAHCNGKEAPRP